MSITAIIDLGQLILDYLKGCKVTYQYYASLSNKRKLREHKVCKVSIHVSI